mmetsp:Transcript_99558/g.319548  ORF Transcript_99558/g.319548 Transcript_99558/m.319548 type:complete len:726 (+) Transcript_99558:109-2286(+)
MVFRGLFLVGSLAALVGLPAAHAAVAVAVAAADAASNANPIRRVVTMLTKMQAKVLEEGTKEEALFDQFMCYCSKGQGDLQASVDTAERQIAQDTTGLEKAEALKVQLGQELKEHTANRVDAQGAVAQAKSLREKEHTGFSKESSEAKTNIAALGKAITAIDNGASGTFLQTPTAKKLRRLTVDMDLSTADRDMLSAFLSFSSGQAEVEGYVPKSSEITGILKEMKDTMEKDLAGITSTEEGAVKDFGALVGAKEKEIAANSEAIESKTSRVGQVGVEIVQLKEDLDDNTAALLDDRKFLADMSTSCTTKKAEWEERSKTRGEELVALAETIKILNDDEALELFKKTLPSPALLQTQVSGRILKHRAIEALKAKHGKKIDTRLNMIMIALAGRSGNFEKVLKMIDDMTALLGKEQQDDDSHNEYCKTAIDKSEDEHKVLDREYDNLEKAKEEATGGLAQLGEEIKSLTAGINALDKSVAESTEVRKAENSEYKETMAADQAAKELIGVAKNRLAKFYSPATYSAPPKRELSEQDRIFVNNGGVLEGAAVLVQVDAHRSRVVEAPPPPPESWGVYQNKGQENNGVMAMLDMLVADLDKEMQEMDVQEKDGQNEYEAYMADSQAKRGADAKLLSEKEEAKAELEAELQKLIGEAQLTLKAGMAKGEFIKDLHAECDWLVANFGARKEARSGELDSLKNAKAILSGADFSFLQRPAATATGRRLRGPA